MRNGDSRQEREDRKRLEVALSKAIDIPEETGLNDDVEEYEQMRTYFEVFDLDSNFSNLLMNSVKRRGKGKFYKSMDPLNRIISAEETLKERKKRAQGEDIGEKNEVRSNPASQGYCEGSEAGSPADERNSATSETARSKENLKEFLEEHGVEGFFKLFEDKFIENAAEQIGEDPEEIKEFLEEQGVYDEINRFEKMRNALKEKNETIKKLKKKTSDFKKQRDELKEKMDLLDDILSNSAGYENGADKNENDGDEITDLENHQKIKGMI